MTVIVIKIMLKMFYGLQGLFAVYNRFLNRCQRVNKMQIQYGRNKCLSTYKGFQKGPNTSINHCIEN